MAHGLRSVSWQAAWVPSSDCGKRIKVLEKLIQWSHVSLGKLSAAWVWGFVLGTTVLHPGLQDTVMNQGHSCSPVTNSEKKHIGMERHCVFINRLSLSVPKRTSLRPDKPVHKLSCQYALPSFDCLCFLPLSIFSSSPPLPFQRLLHSSIQELLSAQPWKAGVCRCCCFV